MTTGRVWSSSTGTEDGLTWDTAWHTVDSARAGQSLSSDDLIMVHTGTTPHLETSSTANIDWTGSGRDIPLYIVGVDKDNSDAYNISTVDNMVVTGGTYDVVFDGCFAIYGLKFKTDDKVSVSLYLDQTFYVQDCGFTLTNGTGADFTTSYYNRFVNCTFDLQTAGRIYVEKDGVEFINPTFIGSTEFSILKTGAEAIFVDVVGGDFSSTNAHIINMTGPNKTTFTGCVEHATKPIMLITDDRVGAHIDLTGCDTVAGNNHWRTERILVTDRGSIVLVDTIYRSSGECTYDGTNEYSMLHTTGKNGCFGNPTTGTWNGMYVAAADNKNIKVYIASTASRTDKDIWIEVEYFSSTSNTLKTVAVSRPASPVDAATTLPTATGEVWDGITESPSGGQYITLPSNIDIKKSGMLRWRVNVGLILTDTYVCMAAEIV